MSSSPLPKSPAAIAASFQTAFVALPANVAPARRAVVAFLSRAGVSGMTLDDIGLAVSEVVTNVIQHAYVGRAPGPVRVEVELRPPEVEVVVTDEGSGLMPRPDSPGLGLGLPLLATVSDRIDMRELPGGGTRMGMWFSL